MKKTSLGQLLIKEGIINESQLQKAIKEQEKSGDPLQHILVTNNLASEKDILKTLSKHLNIPLIQLSQYDIDTKLSQRIPAKLAYRYKVVPIKEEENVILLAVCNPLDVHALDDIRLLTECEIKVALSTETDILKALKSVYGIGAETIEQMEGNSQTTNAKSQTPDNTKTPKNDTEVGDDASIITFVNQIIREAHQDRATDIHIEPFENDLIIRYRIDGVLHAIPAPFSVKDYQSAIISRIKIMANMNIAEKRLPQDGRIQFTMDDGVVDIRVSTLPVIHGESVDLRILPRSQMFIGMEQLGLPKDYLQKIEILIKRPHGIILVTGPTGNGKTTTLYACLSKINTPDKKIITVEDPVEYQLKGINQVPVHGKIGLTFANGLRSILRQDPDVIMVGEIRDNETAEIAIRASLTGHLVFSTLHTNNAPGAVTRLVDMGIEPYLVSSSIEAVLAQRLLRLVCTKCRVEDKPDKSFLDRIDLRLEGDAKIYKAGLGCEECKQTGYKGRTGIYELLMVEEDMRKQILEKTSTDVILKAAIQKGMRTLRMDGWDKVKAGMTTIEEVIRVTQEGDII